jgi:ribosomal protein S27E
MATTSGDSELVDDPSRFLKCPECHRTTTVSLTIHPDGDVQLACRACGAIAIGHPLNYSDRVYQ